MAHFSKVLLDPLRRRTQELLSNPHTMHQELYDAVTRQPVQERVLWRLDSSSTRGLELLVLTASPPSWDKLVRDAGWGETGPGHAVVRPYTPLLERLEVGRPFSFRVRANPVSATRRPESPTEAQRRHLSAPRARGVRVAHRTADEQLAWFTEHVPGWGFELVATKAGDDDVLLMGRDQVSFRKGKRPDAASGDRVTLTTATYVGHWCVTDPERARASLLGGIGGGRAYGCGLITLAPPLREQ